MKTVTACIYFVILTSDDIRLSPIQCSCFSLPSVIRHSPFYNLLEYFQHKIQKKYYSFMTFCVVCDFVISVVILILNDVIVSVVDQLHRLRDSK